MTALEMATIAIQERGYLVVCPRATYNLPLVASGVQREGDRVAHPMVAVAETNEADYLEQCRVIGCEPKHHSDSKFYKVVCD